MNKIVRYGLRAAGTAMTILAFSFIVQGTPPPEFAWSSDGAAHPRNEGKTVAVTGIPVFKGSVRDTDFGVRLPSPFLRRIVTMYQYHVKDGKVLKGFTSPQAPVIRGASGKRYSNPSFPDDLRSKDFCQPMSMPGGLKLEAAYAEKLAGLPSSKKMLRRVTGLPEIRQTPWNLTRMENAYGSGDAEPAIGDLRVIYAGLDLAKIGEFTAVGIQRDGVLHLEGPHAGAYEGAIPHKEMRSKFKDERWSAFWGCFLFAFPLLFSSFIRD